MTFQEAKQISKTLNEIVNYNSSELNKFLQPYKSEMQLGLIPQSIKQMDKYKELNENYLISFKKLQEFNKYYIKTFKKEISEERRRKRMVR